MSREFAWVTALVGAALLSSPAHADVSRVRLTAALGETQAACAVEVTIDAVEDDLVNLQEALRLDGTTIGTFADIDPAISGISRRDSVLFGSSAFATWAGFTPDAVLSDKACEGLVAGAVLDFRGSFDEDAGSLTLPSGFGLNTAYDGSDLIDLELSGIEMFALAGSIALGVPVSAGCASAGAVPGLGFTWMIVVAGCLRRRRH